MSKHLFVVEAGISGLEKPLTRHEAKTLLAGVIRDCCAERELRVVDDVDGNTDRETESEYMARIKAWGTASVRVMNLLYILREKLSKDELREAIMRVPVDDSSLVPRDPVLGGPSNERDANLLTGLLWRMSNDC